MDEEQTMRKKNITTFILLPFVLSGCMSLFNDAPEVKSMPIQQAPNPTTLDVAVIASNTKTPIAVHFFQLETDEYFKRLDYFELMKKKRSKLDGEIVKYSKKTLNPSQMEKFHVRPDPSTRYYAIVAGFKDVESNDNWRFIQEIIPERKNDITLILSQNSMKKVYNLSRNSSENSTNLSSKVEIDTDKIANAAKDTASDAIRKKASESIGKIFN